MRRSTGPVKKREPRTPFNCVAPPKPSSIQENDIVVMKRLRQISVRRTYPNKPTGVGLAKYFLGGSTSPAEGGGGGVLFWATIYININQKESNLLVQFNGNSDSI
jgi:hypothetical protein